MATAEEKYWAYLDEHFPLRDGRPFRLLSLADIDAMPDFEDDPAG